MSMSYLNYKSVEEFMSPKRKLNKFYRTKGYELIPEYNMGNPRYCVWFKNIKLFHLSWGFTKAIGKGDACVFNKYSKLFVLHLEMINRALTVFNKKHKTDFYIDLSNSICLMKRHYTLSEYDSMYLKNNVINFEHIYRKIEEAYNSPIELGWNSEE